MKVLAVLYPDDHPDRHPDVLASTERAFDLCGEGGHPGRVHTS